MRIIHGADFHLDSPFVGLPPELAVRRRSEQREIPERLADLSREYHPDAVLLSGDLLDGERVHKDTVEALSAALGKIPAPVFIAPGNHDPFVDRSPYRWGKWPDNVYIFSSGNIDKLELEDCGAVIYGAAFCTPHQEESLLSGFSVAQDGRIHVMVLHAQVDTNGNVYNPVTPEEIAASGLNYLALGHVHRHDGLQWSGNVPWAYCGCPEGRGFDEEGVKGVLCVKLENGKDPDIQFSPLCSRRYQSLQLRVTPADDEASLTARIFENAEPGDLVRVTLTGETGEHLLDTEAIRRQCSKRFFSFSLKDKTQTSLVLWERIDENNLTGLFLRQIRDRQGGEIEIDTLELAASYGLSALENREDPTV